MSLPTGAFVEDPWPGLNFHQHGSSELLVERTAASSLVILKKGASNSDTSSSRKCPPFTLI